MFARERDTFSVRGMGHESERDTKKEGDTKKMKACLSEVDESLFAHLFNRLATHYALETTWPETWNI